MSELSERAVEAGEILALFEELPELIVLIGADGAIRHANRRLLHSMGYTLDGIVGTNIFDYVHPDDLAYMAWAWENREAHPGETGILVQARGRNADGSWRPVEILGLSLLDNDHIGGMVMSMRDLSHQATVADSPARLRSLVDRTSDVLLLLDGDGRIVYANRRLTSHYGHDNDRVAGSPITEILHPDDADAAESWLRDLVAAGGRATSRVRLRVTEPNGVPHDVEWQGTNQFDDPLIDGVIATGRDVTDLVAMEAQVREQHRQLLYTASHDALTGLLNRPAFLEAFATRLAARRDEGDAGDVVVLFCDLDRFKAVNDTYGHQIGDQVLVEVASRFLDVVGPADLLARYGGDEFTILLGDSAGRAVVTGLVGRLKAALTGPIMCGPIAADVGVTVGVCRSGVVEANIDNMLRDADQAMYEGKTSRR